MKLFLTSAGLIPETTGAFLGLLNKKPAEVKVCFIATASYAKHPKGDASYITEERRRWSELGFKRIRELDLRKEKEESLRDKLRGFDVISVLGGNTFYLLKYVRESGFDKALRLFLDGGGIYLGVSAGSIIACKDISPAGWSPDWDENTVGLKDFKGMGLVDFIISPHYKPEHEAIIEENKHKVPYPVIASTDLQAVLVEGGNIQFIGPGEFKKFE